MVRFSPALAVVSARAPVPAFTAPLTVKDLPSLKAKPPAPVLVNVERLTIVFDPVSDAPPAELPASVFAVIEPEPVRKVRRPH